MSSTDTFVLYEGDDPVGTGTARELAAQFGVQERTIYFLSTPSARKRADRSKTPDSRARTTVRVSAEELA